MNAQNSSGKGTDRGPESPAKPHSGSQQVGGENAREVGPLPQQQKTRNNKPRKLLDLLTETPGGAAAISVLFGGLVLGLVTHRLQEASKEKELLLLDAQAFSQEQVRVAREIYNLVGKVAAYSREMMAITEPVFLRTTTLRPQVSAAIEEQRLNIKRDYNLFIREWHTQREVVGMLLTYYYPCSDSLPVLWASIEETSNNYLDCAATVNAPEDRERCIVLYFELQARLEDLTEGLGQEWRVATASNGHRWRHQCYEQEGAGAAED
jgi:hypothetical protein